MGGRGRQTSKFEASLVYRVSSRTARDMQRNPVSKKPKTKKKKKASPCRLKYLRIRRFRRWALFEWGWSYWRKFVTRSEL